jgi:hypothetical protein
MSNHKPIDTEGLVMELHLDRARHQAEVEEDPASRYDGDPRWVYTNE